MVLTPAFLGEGFQIGWSLHPKVCSAPVHWNIVAKDQQLSLIDHDGIIVVWVKKPFFSAMLNNSLPDMLLTSLGKQFPLFLLTTCMLKGDHHQFVHIALKNDAFTKSFNKYECLKNMGFSYPCRDPWSVVKSAPNHWEPIITVLLAKMQFICKNLAHQKGKMYSVHGALIYLISLDNSSKGFCTAQPIKDVIVVGIVFISPISWQLYFME